jgi:glucosylglycerate hydrolase
LIDSSQPSVSDGAEARALADRAAAVLRENDLGPMTTAAPNLYPHMWSWDACFIAIGLSWVSVPRAITEIDTLLRAQWRNGMVPHIVFSADAHSYFPGADRWGCAEVSADAPSDPQTSGICQPPVHAIAVARIMQAAEHGSADEREAAEAFLDRSWPRLLAWHRWLATARDPHGVGRVTIHHGWESGMDNSPRWDAPYSRVVVGDDLPPYTRLDRQHVANADERPSDEEYDRYMWLVEEMRRVGYDDAAVEQTSSFAVEDVFFSAVLALACEVMADLGRRHGRAAEEVEETAALAARFRAGVAEAVDPVTGLARDRDRRTSQWLSTQTLAGFAPLLAGTPDAMTRQRLLDLFNSEAWCGHPGFAAALPPSTSPASPAFVSRTYWRGPQWPVVAWLFSWAFQWHGLTEEADRLRVEGLRLLEHGDFGEYYEPFTGEGLGSSHQSWTAAAVLDWVGRS